jgi:transglutaminase-like putative cysteine protease
MNRRWLTEASLLAVALVGAASIARLTSGHAAWRAVLVTAVVGELVAAGLSIRVPESWSPRSWSIVAGAVAVTITAVWVSVPGATRKGLPTATTFRTIDHALKTVGGVHIPMTAGTGVVLLCSLVAGMTAVLTRALPGALGLVPAVALVATSTVALPSTGVALLAVVLAAAAGTTLMSRTRQRSGWPVATVTTLASALCVVLVGTLTGPAAASGGGGVVEGIPPTALSLVSRLDRLQIRDPDLVMFTAVTPVPTYWQVASLSVLDGDTWVPDAATTAALSGRATPVAPVTAPGGRTFTVTVTTANLSSRLLPVPPSTTGVSTATLTSIGVVATEPSRPGEHYRATAAVPTVDTSGGTTVSPAGTSGSGTPGSAAGSGTALSPATVASDTELPAIPPAVTALARSITASASTPLAKAEALTNWFRSRLFHYSLRPTRSTLVSFLTVSHTGSCEQFAGAFTVLARAVGLPTRVAIGFTTGERDGSGQTVVRGIDAHAWPEVYLDGSWISFEPTPELPAGEIAPAGVIGLTAVGTPNPVAPRPLHGSLPKTSLPTPTVPVATGSAAGTSERWPWILGSGLALAGLAAAALVACRRRRRRRPDDELVMAWSRVDRALQRGHMARPPWRTPLAHTHALRTSEPDHRWDTIGTDLEWLATTVEEAAYGHGAADRDVADAARQASRRVAKALSKG